MGNARRLVGLGLAIAIAVALVVYVLLPKAGPSASALVNQPQGPSGPVNHGPWHGRTAPPASPANVTPPNNESGGDDHDGCGTGDTSSHHSDHHGEGAEDGAACHDQDGHDHDGHGHQGGEHDGRHGEDGRDAGGSARDERHESSHHG
jgi:hypothetical protein